MKAVVSDDVAGMLENGETKEITVTFSKDDKGAISITAGSSDEESDDEETEAEIEDAPKSKRPKAVQMALEA